MIRPSERLVSPQILEERLFLLTPSQGFTAVHVATITATCWILLLNALVGFQFLDDGTPVSLGLILASAGVLFIGTGYIALDTAFSWTGHFDSSYHGHNRNIALYVLYQLFPLVCLVVFYVLESVLVLRVLGETKPMSTCTRSIQSRKIHSRGFLPATVLFSWIYRASVESC